MSELPESTESPDPAPGPLVAPEPVRALPALERIGSPAHVLAIQRTSGNQAVSRMVARRPGPAAPS